MTQEPRFSQAIDSPTVAAEAHWHGFTQMASYQPLAIERAEGCWLHTTDGRKLFDGVSSLWCNVHGHNHPVINEAIVDQLHRVAHVTSLGMSAATTDRLAERLVDISPGDLSHVFFSCDGSSAVEAALKMAFQYWQQCDDPQPQKNSFLALSQAYHGDTTGAVSLGGIKYFHQLFAPILFSPIRGPRPCTYRLPDTIDAEQACDFYAGEIETLLQEHHQSLAALVMEPLVQGAAGMITHPVGLLQKIRQLCDQYNVLLICDEVATGFGRTGKLFACEHESVTPDILCLGKGLTGGYLPMAATLARPHLYEAFLGELSELKQFFHGHTFGGNPLAAAAALASIDLIEQDGLVDAADAKATRLRSRIADQVADHANVGSIRGRGLMIGIELVADRDTKQPFDSADAIGHQVCQAAIDRGVWIRPLSDVVIVMPPLVASDQELDDLADVVAQSIEAVLGKPSVASKT
ncbi:adenosylmethionine--8-amino-7-oxononanoate transaminase [Planctomycetes bacterium K23_9]|uniref:Adenosylmethionine-8-amino-7-oxononanoate aminotransferase n=1 Tax=Stieleria marina TaxID=1930275 RepID=A0A517NX87_9BACT|nr:L-Lysine-8-amino-7-oxononanoate aminotransferase [Planctomycetes bacterium K23_9]